MCVTICETTPSTGMQCPQPSQLPLPGPRPCCHAATPTAALKAVASSAVTAATAPATINAGMPPDASAGAGAAGAATADPQAAELGAALTGLPLGSSDGQLPAEVEAGGGGSGGQGQEGGMGVSWGRGMHGGQGGSGV